MKPENAEEQKRVNEVLSKVKNPIMGFLDESAIQLNPGKRRVINTPYVSYRERKEIQNYLWFYC